MTHREPGIVELAQAIRNGIAITHPLGKMQVLHGIAKAIDTHTDAFGIRIAEETATPKELRQDELIAEFLALLTQPFDGVGAVQSERIPALDGHACAELETDVLRVTLSN